MDLVLDPSLVGTLILGAVFLPWVVEVALQLRLQARFLDAIPAGARAALPRHPRRSGLAFLASWRFHLALWRAFRRDLPDDDTTVLVLKHEMRATLRRELLWIAIALAVLAALLATGWRPARPSL